MARREERVQDREGARECQSSSASSQQQRKDEAGGDMTGEAENCSCLHLCVSEISTYPSRAAGDSELCAKCSFQSPPEFSDPARGQPDISL